MPYAPTVNDNSGQILGQYQTQSAEIKAAGNEALANGIMQGATSAIGGVLGAYTQARTQAAGGKAFKEFMGVAGPSMGINEEQLKMFKSMKDQDAFQMSQMFMPVAPSMVSANSFANNYSARNALANQAAANANQVPPNQQPINTGIGASANNTAPQQQSFFRNPNIQTQDQFWRTNGN